MPAWNEENVVHLLNRAGFGPDTRDVARFLKYGHAVAVEKLLAKPRNVRGPGKADNDAVDRAKLRQWWIKRMFKASSDRLVEKMTLFWHDHFATNIDQVQVNSWMAQQNRVLRFFGLGSFKTLVLEVTRDPAMLEYLDGRRNRLGRPNENYGRELQELFTLGVVDVQGADNYTQADVTQISRALTGFVTTTNGSTDEGWFDKTRFDGGNKTLYAGKPWQRTGNLGVVDGPTPQSPPLAQTLLPPDRNVLDAILAHKDTRGKPTALYFIARKLWEWLAHPAPSLALLDAVCAPFVDGNGDLLGGDFQVRDLLRQIFLRDEFYSDEAKTSSVKNPCEYVCAAIRATRAGTNATLLPDQLAEMGMDLFAPPTVNGWSNGLAWTSSGLFLARLQFAMSLAAGRDSTMRLNPARVVSTRTTTSDQAVDQILAALHVASRVPPAARQALVDYFAGQTNFADPAVLDEKVRGAIYLALALPEAHVH